jgi:hypothetical protein
VPGRRNRAASLVKVNSAAARLDRREPPKSGPRFLWIAFAVVTVIAFFAIVVTG